MQNETTRTLCPSCEYPAPAGKTYCSNRCASNADPLAKAVEYLGAVEVEPYCDEAIGAKMRQFAVKDSNGRWYIAGEGAMRFAAVNHNWNNAMLRIVAMPSWWSPSQRTRKCEAAPDGCDRFCITADLTTGEEVPA